MTVNLPDQSTCLPFQDLAGQTVALDKRKTVKQDLSSQPVNFISDLIDWPSSLPFYPACDQCQLIQAGLSLQAQFPPQDYNPFCQFSKLKQWEKHLLIRPGSPMLVFLPMWISEVKPVTSVDTVFWLTLPAQTWAALGASLSP